MVGHFDDSEAVLEFVSAAATCRRWRRSGRAAPTTSCAPRSGRWWWTSTRQRPTSTRRWPGLPRGSRGLPQDYAGYYERCRQPDSPAAARPERGGLSRARGGHDHLRQGQGDGADLGRVLRQRHQRHARRLGRLGVPRAAGAGGLRHRVLAARGGQAAADAEAEEPGRADRHRHRRRRRHRRGHRRAAARAKAPAWCSPTSTRRRSRRRRPTSPPGTRPTWCGRSRWT